MFAQMLVIPAALNSGAGQAGIQLFAARLKCKASTRPAGERVTFFACAKKVTKETHPRWRGLRPSMASDCASGGRVPLTGHPWPAAESARSIAPTLRALSSATRRATGGPVWAASCRRSNGNSAHKLCAEANDLIAAVQGCTDSWINAPFAVPSIAGVADQARRGAAMDRRACAAVHGRTVCATPQRREAQGSLIRRRRIRPPRPVLDLFGYFLGQCQKVTRAAELRGSFGLGSNSLARRASESSALHEVSKSKELDYARLPAAHPSGHSLRECSLRHPASAVQLALE